MCSNFDWNKDISEILDDINKISEDFDYYEVEAKPGVEELLKDFKTRGIKMVAATSSPRSHVERALTRVGLYNYIDKIFTDLVSNNIC